MNKRLIINVAMIVATVAFLAGMYLAATIESAKCSWCSPASCYSSASCGGSDCVCVKEGGKMLGRCYSINRGQP